MSTLSTFGLIAGPELDKTQRLPLASTRGMRPCRVGKIDLPYLKIVRSKGRTYHYYQRNGLRFSISGAPESHEFQEAYRAIHQRFETGQGDTGTAPGSMAALVEAYLSSPEFNQLGPKTRRDYRRYLDRIKSDRGKYPVANVEKPHVLAYRDEFAETPRTANYMMQVLRLLFGWGVDRGWLKANPASRPRQLRTGQGHRPWEESEIKAYRDHWDAGTVERVAFEILLNTGQRGGDVAAMTRRHIQNGMVSVAQEKTGERVWIPMSNDLRAVLDPWLEQHQHLVLLVGENGRPFKTQSGDITAFRHMMLDARRAAGLANDSTTHGIRYTAAAILRELGCDDATIQSITGHRTAEMARKYADKKRLARLAISRLDEARKGTEGE